MASFNKITIVGYLGRDPETRYLSDGTAVCAFSVATTEKKKGGEEATTWFKLNAWGKLAEVCQQYLKKGSQVYAEGRLSVSEYTDREGNNRQSLDVRVNEIQFLSKSDGDAKPQQSAPQQRAAPSRGFAVEKGTGRVVSPPIDDSDEIPF